MVQILVGIDAKTFLYSCRQMRRNLLRNAGVGHRTALPLGRGARPQWLGCRRKQARQLLRETGRRILQQHAVLGAPGSGHAGLHLPQVQFQRLGVLGLRRAGGVEEALLFVVGLHQRNLLLAAAGQPQIAQGLRIHRKDAAGGPILGRHVADRRAVGQRQRRNAGAVELHKLAHHAQLAQGLCHGQHQIGRRRALAQLAGQPEAHHLRYQHRHRLAKHRRLGLYAAYAPAQHAQAVDHGSVRIGAHQRVRISNQLAVNFGREHHASQVFQIHLVADAHSRRHSREVAEGRLAPLEEGITLPVSLELQQGIGRKSAHGAVLVHLDGMIDD